VTEHEEKLAAHTHTLLCWTTMWNHIISWELFRVRPQRILSWTPRIHRGLPVLSQTSKIN